MPNENGDEAEDGQELTEEQKAFIMQQMMNQQAMQGEYDEGEQEGYDQEEEQQADYPEMNEEEYMAYLHQQ